MKKTQVFLLLVTMLFAGMAVAWVLQFKNPASDTAATTAKEDTYDRVMRTQIIRCGYIDWPPFLKKDPNSGQLSGIFYEYVERLGKSLHLKIEWTEEMGWSDFPAALQSGRIDGMCSGSFANTARARVIDFVHPVVFQPLYGYVRVNDARFDNNMEAINDPSVTIVTVEGATGSVVAAQDFPNAKNIQLPEMTSLADTMVSLTDGKGDVAIVYPTAFVNYDRNNPGKLRQIAAKMPLGMYATGIAIPAAQERFRRMLDLATEEMLSSGQIEKIIEKYGIGPDTMFRVALPYQENRQ